MNSGSPSKVVSKEEETAVLSGIAQSGGQPTSEVQTTYEGIKVTRPSLTCYPYKQNDGTGVSTGIVDVACDRPHGQDGSPDKVTVVLKAKSGSTRQVSDVAAGDAETPWFFVFVLEESHLASLDLVEAEIEIDGKVDSLTYAVSSPLVSALLAFESTSYDFGRRPLRVATDATLKVTYSGQTPAQVKGMTFSTDAFNFPTQAYPGVDVGCPETILKVDNLCLVGVRFVASTLHGFGGTMTISYVNGPRLVLSKVDLSGRGYLMAARALGQHEVTSDGALRDIVDSQELNRGGISAHSLNLPQSVAVNATSLSVADTANNRILVWRDLINLLDLTTNSTDATVVLGQSSFTSGSIPGTASSGNLSGPSGMVLSETQIYVADTGQNRILSWPLANLASSQPATSLIGQDNFTDASPNRSQGSPMANSMNRPSGIAITGSRLYVADLSNNRVISFPDATAGTAAMADKAVNQLHSPYGIRYSGSLILIADTAAGKILVWNDDNTSRVLVDNTHLVGPRDALIHGNQLFVADTGNNRILVWTSIPTATSQTPDFVIGQSCFSSAAPGATAYGLASPSSLALTSDTLIVADRANNRVVFIPLPATWSTDWSWTCD